MSNACRTEKPSADTSHNVEQFFYRYRSIENLLCKHEELEKQEIYFAEPGELNDPMEGYQDVYWEGDQILWKNLFRHYILCLLQAMALTQIMGPDFKPDQVTTLLYSTPSVVPDPMKTHHAHICAAFFAEQGIEEFLNLLGSLKEKVRREELAFYLTSLHAIALHHVINRLKDTGLVPQMKVPPFPRRLIKTTISNLRTMLSARDAKTSDSEQIAAFLFASGNRGFHQNALLQLINSSEEPDRGWRFIGFEFVDFYCKNVSIILYPRWYAACFVRSATHAAMWAHYGSRHEGVCLKFRAKENATGTSELTLQGVIATSSAPHGQTEHYGQVQMRLDKINYTNAFPEIDFFRSLGRFSIPVINSDWYSNGGELSETARTIFTDEANWRETYWKNLALVATTKFDDWKQEDEYRLVINGNLENALPPSRRVYRYQFSDLEGIIFGINTSLDNKLKIMKIIEQKCVASGRQECGFWTPGV